jgi:hypothetical protein
MVKWMRSLWFLGLCSIVYSDNYPPKELTIVTCYGAGFFAEMNRVVDNMIHFSKENLKKVTVDWSDEYFLYKDDPHENGWDLYFEPIVFSEDSCNGGAIRETSGGFYHEIHDQHCIDQWMNYDKHLCYRLAVHEFMNKYIRVKDHILSKVDEFMGSQMRGYFCIGAHIRFGSDHEHEAPKGTPSLKEYTSEIDKLIRMHGKDRVKIYLATDSQYVVKKFEEKYPNGMVLSINTHRTEYKDVPHLIYGNGDYWLNHKEEFHSKKPGYYGGEGVLIDCLLLSKCDVFLHSTSNIASFVSYFNPHIESIYLPKSAETWPCRYNLSPSRSDR